MLKDTQNTPLRVKMTPRKVGSSKKYANTPSRLFAATPLSVRKQEEAKKIKKAAAKKQQENAKARKALIGAKKAVRERQKAEQQQRLHDRHLAWKDTTEKLSKVEQTQKAADQKRKRMQLLLSERHKRARTEHKQKELSDKLTDSSHHSQDVAAFKKQEKMRRRQSMAGRRTEMKRHVNQQKTEAEEAQIEEQEEKKTQVHS